MANDFLTFQKFNDIGLANEIGERLAQNDIAFEIENTQTLFDPSFANNSVEPDIYLKIKGEDFPRAQHALEEFYKNQLDSVEKDYYLFDFTDEELIEIISKPDEWGPFDYQLSQKILKDRGKEVSPTMVSQLKTERINELAKPETIKTYWIVLGYLCAILGGFFGLIIGWFLAYFQKTLPNGQRIYVHSERERKHGKRIFFLAIIGLIFWVVNKFEHSIYWPYLRF